MRTGGRGDSCITRGILLLASCALLGCSHHAKTPAAGAPAARPSAARATLDAATVAAFDAKIDAARRALDVPGAAVALVKGGGFALAKGYGTRDLASGAPVTPDTVFRIGSLTKSFTSALVAALADDGVLTFDTRAKDLDPSFKLPTPALTDGVTLRELFGMGTGLAEPNDSFWWDYPRAEDLLATLGTLEERAPGSYLYNNFLFAGGAYVALEAAAPRDGIEAEYARFIDERLLTPLGMSPAAVTDDPSTLSRDFAKSYVLSLADGRLSPELAGFEPLGGVAPAGAIAASVTGLGKYAMMHLAHGVSAEGTRLVSEANLAETYAPQTPLHFDELPWLDHYAAGWITGDDRGVRLLWHDGGVDGYNSCLLLVPADALGLAVLTNGWNGSELCIYLQEELFELVYGASDRDPAAVLARYATLRGKYLTLARKLADEGPVHRDAVAPFLGSYGHRISLELDDAGALWVVAPGSRTRVVPAEKLFRKANLYLLASGPDAGHELTLTNIAGGQKLTVVDPTSGDELLILARRR